MSHKAVPTETFDRILSGLPAAGEAKDEDAEKKKSGGARKMFRRVSNAVRATGGVRAPKEREKGKDRIEKEDREVDEEDKDKGRKSGEDSGDDKGNKKVHFK
ncbi:hypothetical protein L873DRAFT_1788906 [Choiromyces venosus 120613-1]|uniref:Uncharacterized protein n=1 Tax=Choiromyces venosus 120613-1 TaxID=1336337 RepID=A0A3N4JQQ2_9PEZI|nr:hypothetical protein L873DRAFT_1788906 [Choiromyces venosus 120613-1]